MHIRLVNVEYTAWTTTPAAHSQSPVVVVGCSERYFLAGTAVAAVARAQAPSTSNFGPRLFLPTRDCWPPSRLVFALRRRRRVLVHYWRAVAAHAAAVVLEPVHCTPGTDRRACTRPRREEKRPYDCIFISTQNNARSFFFLYFWFSVLPVFVQHIYK